MSFPKRQNSLIIKIAGAVDFPAEGADLGIKIIIFKGKSGQGGGKRRDGL